MNWIIRCLLVATAAVGSALSSAESTNSSTFVYQGGNADLILSVTAVASTGDIWFRLTAPATYDWVAFGIGKTMKGALSFIAYPTKNGSDLELSPRLSTGNSEPAYNPKIDATKVYVPSDPSANQINPLTFGQSGNIAVSGVCYNCTHWSDPPLDLTSKSAPFMFAVGPVSDGTNTRWSNDPNAPLRSHTMYGQFTMDMTQATIESGNGIHVPAQQNTTNGASAAKVTLTPHDLISALHTVLLCLVVGVIVPFDLILLRLFHKTLLHLVFQAISAIFLLVGLALGFYVSTWFVRSRNFCNPHQVIGYLIILVLLVQIPIGLAWRKPRLAGQEPSRWTKLSHQVLTGAFCVLSIVDACLGFNLALQPSYNRLWIPAIIAVFILYLVAYFARACFVGHRKDRAEAIRLERETADVYKQAQEYSAQMAAQYEYAQNGQPHQYGGYGASAPYTNAGAIELQRYGHGPESGVHYESVQVPKSY